MPYASLPKRKHAAAPNSKNVLFLKIVLID
jgi:hypothetical protein